MGHDITNPRRFYGTTDSLAEVTHLLPKSRMLPC